MITLKIDGLDKLKRDLGAGIGVIKDEVRTAMIQATNQVKITARDMAPYDTGNLRRSIFTDIQDNGFTGIIGQDPNMADYGIYQEYGTYKMEAQPFMHPSLDFNMDYILKLFEDAVTKIVNRIVS